MKNVPTFLAQAALLPKPYSAIEAEHRLLQWRELADKQDAALAAWMLEALKTAPLERLLESVFGNSSYLSRLLLLYPQVLHDMAATGPDALLTRLMHEITLENTDLMRHLRIAKGKLALLVALADLRGTWKLEKVTAALSDFAQGCLSACIDSLLKKAHSRGEIAHSESKDSGVIVLGMGKLGGRELNYSSDVDLIIFFEPERLGYKGRHTEQHFMNKLAHDLVNIMQERTSDGYVFRTDLRLRPDPASTPPAVTTDAAYFYYESVGQNWERAAMIKARPVAGDIAAGDRFLKGIAPFMWRKSLDFAAINDIHSIKRQMDSARSSALTLPGHNIKLGQGGIREIEFYAQIHQLIWGGRENKLRLRGTCETLARLTEMGLVKDDEEKLLYDAYGFLRRLEHRLQMVADEQTHSLPESPEGLKHIACFMGYDSLESFEREVMRILTGVHAIYASSFKSAEQLGDEGNLVFTGTSHDPETLETLRQMGYVNPETVSEIVMGWHHGSRRATRTKRARELLTELMPTLLKRLSETANADIAFLKFNDFLCNLPAGVQLFSLFNVNPHLLGLIADIMGSAPTLADTLSKSPELLDAVLSPDFYGPLPSPAQIEQQLNDTLTHAQDFEARMEVLRQFRNERQFQAGVQLLEGMIAATQTGAFLSQLAHVVIGKALDIVTTEFAESYGTISGSHFAVIALGKLGSREMTFSSDIDLVFVYDAKNPDVISDGKKGFGPHVYFNRLAQRFVGALSAMGQGGRLYEVDTRLRPSGTQGLLAVSSDALSQYFEEQAWTFEFMAFTKARVICGDAMTKKLENFIHQQLIKPRDMKKLQQDARDMRDRIEKEFGTKNPWDIKYVQGGLVNMDFIAQYLMLRHAPDTPGAEPGGAAMIFNWLKDNKRLETKIADELIDSDHFLGQIFNLLRLCSDRAFDETSAPQGLKKLLVESVKEKDFASLKAHLIRVEELVHRHYIALVHN